MVTTELSNWQMMADLEGGGDYRGIGLVKVVWKLVIVIINYQIISSISFHDVLPGSQAGCGMVTASLKANCFSS